MGASGVITNTNDDFRTDDEGYNVNAEDTGTGANSYDIVDFSDGAIYGHFSGGPSSIVLKSLSGATLTLKSAFDEDVRIETGGGAGIVDITQPISVRLRDELDVSADYLDWPWGLQSTAPQGPASGIRCFLGEDTDGDGNTVGRPAYVQSNGNAWWWDDNTSFSDRRGKKNIERLEAPIDALIELSGYFYERKGDRTIDEGRKLGLIAQEVRKSLPEAVLQKTNGDLHLDYQQLHALHVEAGKKLVEVGRDHEKRID